MPAPAETVTWENAVWNEKLLSRERAANMSGTWGLKMDGQYLRCAQCDGNVTMLPRDGKIINVDGIIAAVVRHMVMSAHGYTLSGGALNER